MCLCRMIGGCVDGMDYHLPAEQDKRDYVIVERPPGPKEELWYYIYKVVQKYDGGYVGICVEQSTERPILMRVKPTPISRRGNIIDEEFDEHGLSK